MNWKSVFSTLLVLCCLGELSVAGTFSFKPKVTYPVGTTPVAVAVGDFNGDAKPDLAVANFGDPTANNDGSISILIGNGDGTFQAALSVAAGKNPSSIAVADFNRDGKLDLAVVNGDGGVGKVGILLGNGDGTFQPAVDYATGSGPRVLAVADLNGDDKPDLVVTNVAGSSVGVLLGNGDGTLQAHVDYTTGGTPQGLAVGDFNGDANVDLAVPTATHGVAILLGRGDGTFQTAVLYDAGPVYGPVAVAVGDFNGDKNPDLIVDYFVGTRCCPIHWIHRLDLLAGNGDGTFQLATGVVANSGSGVAQADFNGDGKLDLVQPTGWLFGGNGDGTFQDGVNFSVASIATQVTAADLNGDKSPDIVMANTGVNSISVVLNAVSTDFSISASAISPASVSPGQSATSTVSLNLVNTFDNPVSLSCSVQPAQAGAPTCSLNSNAVTFDGSGKATAMLTINAASSVASRSSLPSIGDGYLLCLPVAGFAFLGSAVGFSRKRKLLVVFAGAALFASLGTQLACGGGGSGPKSTAYTITVTGTSGATQHSTAVTLTVQ